MVGIFAGVIPVWIKADELLIRVGHTVAISIGRLDIQDYR